MSPDPTVTPPVAAHPPLLEVSGLRVEFGEAHAVLRPVEDVSFTVSAGETLALVGESGCGKTLTATGVLGVAPPGGRLSGRVRFEGRDLLTLRPDELLEVRGARVGFVFQEPSVALNPVYTIGEHIREVLEVHGLARGEAALARAAALLEEVVLSPGAGILDSYPHQLSGGMAQRAVIALALACDPSLLVADEPTTALDVTTQAQVLALLRRLRDRRGLALLLVTHDLALARQHADRIAVVYAGRIVEQAPAAALFARPSHPYTRALLASAPGGPPGQRLRAIPGGAPSPGARPPGCAFAPRCPDVGPDCAAGVPGLYTVEPDHAVRCILCRGEESAARDDAAGGS